MTYFKKSVFLLAFLTIFVTLASCSNATSKKSANLQSTVEKTDKKHNLDYDNQNSWKF